MRKFWIILPAALVALGILASFLGVPGLWGIDAWKALSPLAALAAALLIIPQMMRTSVPDPFRGFRRIRSKAARGAVFASASALLLWLLRSRAELWGERPALREAIETGAYRAGSPLGTFIQREIYRFMNGIFLTSADSVLTFFSICAGVIYAALAIRAAALLLGGEKGGDAGRPAAAVLLSSGFVALFFGAGGNAQIAIAAAAAFVIESIRALRGNRSLSLPAILLAAAVLSHFSAILLVPGFIYLVARGARAPGARRRSLAAGGLFVLSLAAVEIAIAVIARRTGGTQTVTLAMSLPFGRHALTNVLNALLVIGPASIVAVFLLAAGLRRKARSATDGAAPGETAFLGVCAVSALAGLFVFADLIDGGIGWHAIAVTGPVLAICALHGLARELAATEHLKRALAALFLAGLFHTTALVLVSVSPQLAEKRLSGLDLAPGRTEMVIADFALGRGELMKARSLYLASEKKDPSNAPVKIRLGRIAMRREEYAEAITHFLGAHELRPDAAHERFELAEALIANRWFPEAIAHLETLTAAYPDSVAFWRRLGFARNNGNRYEPAIAAYERALALEPRNEQNLRNLVSALLNRGAELQDANRLDDAQAIYERVIETYPRDWRAYNNLATIEMKRGNMEKARALLEKAFEDFPYEPSLHFNMGIVFDKLGDKNEALRRMRLALELNPMYSAAAMHIERLERELGIVHAPELDSLGSPPDGS